MPQDSSFNRRSIRLIEFDYAQPGAYFITICTYRRRQLFGRVRQRHIEVNWIGRIVREEWWRTEAIRKNILLDQFVVMPNHFHAILHITHSIENKNTVRAHCNAPLHRPAKSVSSTIGLFKGSVTRKARMKLGDPSFNVWQRNYYEHIIRNDHELNKLRRYIINNPPRWVSDRYGSST
jgi:REP element-mobilizing transposase RayT